MAPDRMPIVDAHHHIWDIETNYLPWLCDDTPIPFRYGDYSAIRRNYSIDDFRRDAARFDLVGSVYVEAEWSPEDPLAETRWLHAVADAAGLPTVMVAQAWLDRDDAADVLAAQGSFPRVRGIRHKPKAAPRPDAVVAGTPGSMSDSRWREGFALLAPNGLSFDLQVVWWHLPEAAELARDFPGTQIIVNHTALPADRSDDGLAGWRKALETAAAQPNIALKISGIGVPGQRWTPELNGAIVRDAISIFGTDRCMFASNFPVDSLVATYDEIFDGFLTITEGMGEKERRAIFHDNAVRIYRMG